MFEVEIDTSHGSLIGYWRGGPYIDLLVESGDPSTAYDVINVWDYRAGRAKIPYTGEAVAQALLERLEGDLEDMEYAGPVEVFTQTVRQVLVT